MTSRIVKTRRSDGKDGWKKDSCHYSKTGWAWHREENGQFICTCIPCKAPKWLQNFLLKEAPMTREPKIHWDTQITTTSDFRRLTLCQRYAGNANMTRDPAKVTCKPCLCRMHPKNVYWMESKP
jgi:hypothetical protein